MKRTRLAARSAKRISDTERRHEVVEEVIARDGYICSAIGVIPNHQCRVYGGRQELEAHEVIPRSAWPSGWLVADNVRLVCPLAHDWIGDNPAAALELGLHGKSWMRPDGHCGYFGQGADWGDR